MCWPRRLQQPKKPGAASTCSMSSCTARPSASPVHHAQALQIGLVVGGGGSIPTTVSGELASVIASVSQTVTAIEQLGDHFSIHGHFHTFHVRARSLKDGSCAAAVIVTNSTFSVEWMFALWDVVGFSPKTQAKYVVAQLWECLHAMKPLPSDFLILDDDTVRGLGAPPTPRQTSSRMVVGMSLLWIATVAYFADWPGLRLGFRECRSRRARAVSHRDRSRPPLHEAPRGRSTSPERSTFYENEYIVV